MPAKPKKKPSRFRPKRRPLIETSDVLTTRVPVQTADRFARWAYKLGYDRSSLLRIEVDRALRRYDRQGPTAMRRELAKLTGDTPGNGITQIQGKEGTGHDSAVAPDWADQRQGLDVVGPDGPTPLASYREEESDE